MSELPQRWTWATLAEVTQNVASVNPEHTPTKDFGYVDISAIDNKTYSISVVRTVKGKDCPSRAKRPVQPNDVLFSNVRTYLRNIALVPANSTAQVCSTGFTVLRPNGAVDPRFLFRWVLTDSFIERVTPKQTGTHYPATSDRIVRSEKIPLPPLNEQRRIVAKLEKLLSRVNAAQERLTTIPRILKRFRQSVLADAMYGKLSADWRRQKVSMPIERGEIDTYTDGVGWTRFSLGDVVFMIDGDRGRNYPKLSDYQSNGYCLFLSTKNVREFGFLFEDVVFVSESKHRSLRSGTLQRGDVVITTRGTLGNVAVYDNRVPYEVVRINSGMLILREKHVPLSSKFLMLYVASPLFLKQLEEKRSGSAQPQLPAKILKTFSISLPQLDEQHEIVRRVEALFKTADELEARYLKAKAHVDKLTQSILAKAFRGELVPQDPNDEPASVLLERIKAERNGSAVVKRRSRK